MLPAEVKTQIKTAQTSIALSASLMVSISSVALFLSWGMMVVAGFLVINLDTVGPFIPRTQDPVFGESRVAILLANFAFDTSEPWTVEEIDEIFNGQNDSVHDYYVENSYKKFTFTADVYGWYTLNWDRAWTCTPNLPIIQLADVDVNFSQYDVVIFATPSLPGCFAGIEGGQNHKVLTNDGEVTLDFAHILGKFGGETLMVMAHELGHSLGLGHSNMWLCPVGPYNVVCSGDSLGRYDLMSSVLFYMNAPNKNFIGWLSEDQIMEVVESGSYILEAVDLNSSGIKMLKIPLEFRVGDENVKGWYYVEYRMPIGYSGHTEYMLRNNIENGILIYFNPFEYPTNHSLQIDGTPDTPNSNDSAVYIGDSYNDSINNVSITLVQRMGSSMIVDVRIERNEFQHFRSGDANADKQVNITDPIFLLANLFQSGPNPPCDDAADANDDGTVDISDAIKILLYMFGNVTELPAPGGVTAGPDPTADEQGCETSQ